MYREPELGEIRQSGFIMSVGLNGVTYRTECCQECAAGSKLRWQQSPSPGQCVGCECMLEP